MERGRGEVLKNFLCTTDVNRKHSVADLARTSLTRSAAEIKGLSGTALMNVQVKIDTHLLSFGGTVSYEMSFEATSLGLSSP